MRELLLLSLVTTACSTDDVASLTDSTPSSVRERLAQPTRLMIDATASSGSIVVGHYVDGVWQTSTVPLSLDNGALSAKLDGNGHIIVTELGLGFAPLTLPLDTNAQLTHVRLDLGAATPATTTTWNDEDSAAATASISLGLSWALLVGGTATPLGGETFPSVPIQIALDGDGAFVDGTIDVSAPGKLWRWADLIELDDLSLTLTAATK